MVTDATLKLIDQQHKSPRYSLEMLVRRVRRQLLYLFWRDLAVSTDSGSILVLTPISFVPKSFRISS